MEPMTTPIAKPELLAPAGDWECIKAAVANGADAIYFGLTSFNARARAHNFEPDELPKIMQYLHERGVKGYVTFNILIFTQEMEAALALLEQARAANVDAVIVQDMGLAWAIQRLLPGLAVHGSTQMTLTEPRAVNLVQQLGVERVILARELSASDVGKIHQATAMPLEVFVHGALCVAYSGQCLTSEALGGRSANRGQCAQACRMPYELLVDGKPRDLGDRAYLLSPQDLAAHELVNTLASNGVVSFKIEGRLKKADYVAATVQAYRQAIDSRQPLTKQERLDLEQTFSRGLTQGFLGGINHQTLVPGRSPKKRGICIGTVVSISKHGVMAKLADTKVLLESLVKPGDGIVFDEGKPEGNETGGRVWRTQRTSNEMVEIVLDKRNKMVQHVAVGAIVWKTDDPALTKRLEKSYAQDKPVNKNTLDLRLEGKLGGKLTLRLTTTSGAVGTATWPGPLERAQKHPASREMILEQLGRLHDTPYQLGKVELQVDLQLMLPKSVLNELRRRALVELLLQTEQAQQRTATPVPVDKPMDLATWRQELKQKVSLSEAASAQPQLALMVRSMQQLHGLLDNAHRQDDYLPSLIYCDFEDVRQYREAVVVAKQAKLPVGLATLRVIKPGEESWLKLIDSYGPDYILARNLTSLSFYRQHSPGIPLIGDFSLNVVNDVTAAWMKEQGTIRLTPGFDLNWEQLQALLQQSQPGLFEVVMHYHMPMFHNEHCVFAALLSTGKDWRDCGRPCDRHQVELRDHAGALFPVRADAGCRNTVFNALPQSAAEYLPAMQKLGLKHFRIELLKEDPSQIYTLLQAYWRILRGQDDGKTGWKQLQVTQQLGVTRGTLQLT